MIRKWNENWVYILKRLSGPDQGVPSTLELPRLFQLRAAQPAAEGPC